MLDKFPFSVATWTGICPCHVSWTCGESVDQDVFQILLMWMRIQNTIIISSIIEREGLRYNPPNKRIRGSIVHTKLCISVPAVRRRAGRPCTSRPVLPRRTRAVR